jgi:hypothetical protein
MSLFPGQGLAEAIVLELRRGPSSIQSLILKLHAQGLRVTKQGVYKSLRALREDEVVFLNRGELSLSVRWLQRIEQFVTLAQRAYIDPASGARHFLNLADGDRITYSFRDPTSVDAFWNHILYILFEAYPNLDRWYAYVPHCWFLIARRSEELALKTFMTKRGCRYLVTAAGKTPLDRFVAKDFDGVMSQYHMLGRALFPGRRERLGAVLNVFGDFVIEAEYDPKTVQTIEEFYRKHKTIDAEGVRALERIVSAPASIRFTISRNKKRAQKLAHQFEKSFYFGKK